MELANIYRELPEPQQGCLYALRSIILQQDTDIAETIKYGMPCFCLKKKPFCYLWMDKKTKEPYILLVKGQYLQHPKLEAGKRSRMKILRINADEDIPVELIKHVLDLALQLYN